MIFLAAEDEPPIVLPLESVHELRRWNRPRRFWFLSIPIKFAQDGIAPAGAWRPLNLDPDQGSRAQGALRDDVACALGPLPADRVSGLVLLRYTPIGFPNEDATSPRGGDTNVVAHDEVTGGCSGETGFPPRGFAEITFAGRGGNVGAGNDRLAGDPQRNFPTRRLRARRSFGFPVGRVTREGRCRCHCP